MTMWVKVCGLRSVADVDVAVEAGADAVGLMLAKSPRQITIDQAALLVNAARGVDTVLVMADASVADVAAAVASTGASGVQVYGPDSAGVASWAKQQGLLVLQPFAVRSGPLAHVEYEEGVIPLLETALPDRYGGGGKTFDWTLVGDFESAFVLAGGLGPDNVGQAIRETNPWGVDASSRLESSPGVKDHQKIRAFVRGAKDNEA